LLIEHAAQPGEQDRADVLDPGDTAAGHEGFGGKVHIDHRPRPGPLRVEWRRHEL
jgi:hypothetical protein